MSKRSALFIVCALALAACEEDPAPEAKPEPAPAATPGVGRIDLKGRANGRQPPMQMPRMDPQTLKEYRIDTCYFGTLSVRQARDAYLASVGKDEPSEKKLPSFGGAPPPVPPAVASDAGAPNPPASGSGAPAAASARASASTSAAGPSSAAASARAHSDATIRAPHERNARACPIAVNMKEPEMPGVDGVLADFSAFAVELTKSVSIASGYYQREEYKTDGFAKGKELHKTLLEQFGKLDEMSGRLAEAMAGWRKAHPMDPATLEEGQKPAFAATEAARASMLALVVPKVDVVAMKAGIPKLDAAIAQLKAWGDAHSDDPWGSTLLPTVLAFSQSLKDAAAKSAAGKGLDPNDFLLVATAFTTVLDANQKSLARWLIAKGRTVDSLMPRAPHRMLAPPVQDAADK